MRATTHRGRTHADGTVFSAKHNDRNFETENAEHIDAERTSQNVTKMYNIVENCNPETFDEHEIQFYTAHFSAWLDAQNERHKRKGNYKRIKTMDDVRKNKNYCPEEVIFQIGKVGNTVDRETMIAVHDAFIQWHMQQYPQCVILDSAGHFDETTGHFQDRFVWITHDEHGNETIGQEQALSEMGYELPKPDKKMSRYNNRKILYTAEVREKFIQICEEYGLEIEREPKEKSKTGLTLTAYQYRQERAKLDAVQAELQDAQGDMDYINECLLDKKTRLYDTSKQLDEKTDELQTVNAQLQTAQQRARQAEQEREQARIQAEQIRRQAQRDAEKIKEQAEQEREQTRRERQQAQQAREQADRYKQAYERKLANIDGYIMDYAREMVADTNRAFANMPHDTQTQVLTATKSRLQERGDILPYSDTVKTNDDETPEIGGGRSRHSRKIRW